MSELVRHQIFFSTVRPFAELFVRWKFNYQFDSLKEVDGPYLLLPNHNLELDPVLIGVAAHRHLYFVASEHLQRKGIVTKLLNFFLKPITRQKGTSGANTVAKILRTLRSGTSVCIFPEGNRSFNGLTGEILPATGKMARRSGVKLITYRVEGGYLTQPRWSMTLRRGKLTGKLVRVYTPEELRSMTDEQVNEAICRDLYEDAYETQSNTPVAFRGKALALGMESTIFACPVCRQIGTMHSDNTSIFCDCGHHWQYDTFGYLTDSMQKRQTITELDRLQLEILREKLSHSPAEPLFQDTVVLQTIDENHELQHTESGILTAYTDHLECCGKEIPFSDLQGMAIYSRNVLVIFTNSDNQHYEIHGNMQFSALKYQYWYELKRKEG